MKLPDLLTLIEAHLRAVPLLTREAIDESAQRVLAQLAAYRAHQEGPTPGFDAGPVPEQPTRDLSTGSR